MVKGKIRIEFGATIQAIEFNPVSCTDSIEIDIEVDDETKLFNEYDRLQNILRTKVIKNTIEGAKEFRKKRAQLLEMISPDE